MPITWMNLKRVVLSEKLDAKGLCVILRRAKLCAQVKRAQGIFLGDESILYLDCDSYTAIHFSKLIGFYT